jgi:hypothetical protein
MLYNNISELSLIEYTILVTQQRLIMPELSSSIFLPQKHFVDKSKKKNIKQIQKKISATFTHSHKTWIKIILSSFVETALLKHIIMSVYIMFICTFGEGSH